MLSLLKLFKFGIVGFSGMIIDFGITYLCKEKLMMNKYVANILGFSLAVVNNYFLNRIWTFNSANANWQSEFIRFLFFSLTGLVVNTLLIFLLNGKMKINFYLSKAIAIICVFFWNYTLNSVFNFKANNV